MRIGVIGCGQMGKNHLRIISQMRDIELTGLVEPDNAIAN